MQKHLADSMMERIIKVTGKGKLSLKPDTIQFNIQAKGVYKEYAETISKSAKQTAVIRKAVESAGLNAKNLKTVSFNVDSKYESYRDKNDNWKQRFVGYEYRHAMDIKFDNDNALLGRVLTELTKCSLPVEFSFGYTVKDPETVKTELLVKAVENSRKKAEVLADAAGVKLGKIVTVDYSWGELTICSEPLRPMRAAGAAEMYDDNNPEDIDIEADDINVQDSVTIVWEICEIENERGHEMTNIKFSNLNAIMTNGTEKIIVSWTEDGRFKECTLLRKFDTVEPWRVSTKDTVDKAVLKELFNQFVDQLEEH